MQAGHVVEMESGIAKWVCFFREPFEFCDADGWALSSICGGSSEGP